MSFAKRVIVVTITLATGAFGSNKGNTVTLSGYRVKADINVFGGDSGATAQVRISGVTLSLINQITVLGGVSLPNSGALGNTMQVAAGIEGQALTVVFDGVIQTAWGDFNSPPDNALNISAGSHYGPAVLPVNATSYSGSVSVDSIMKALAASYPTSPGLSYSNPTNIQTQLTNVYLCGSLLDQIRECAKAANCNYKIENNTLTIWPLDGFIPNTGTVPIISPATGLVGYPTFSGQGVDVKTLFLPNLGQGNKFIVQGSALTAANNTWTIASAVHSLESETPGGAWYTVLKGIYQKQ